MKALILFVAWCLLLALSWPIALVALVLAPVVWLVALPFRLAGWWSTPRSPSSPHCSSCRPDCSGIVPATEGLTGAARWDGRCAAGSRCWRLRSSSPVAHPNRRSSASSRCTRSQSCGRRRSRPLPPVQQGDFRTSDLVELVTLDPTIHLDIRYATKRNFLGEPLYSQPRAFLQRPAAEALVRAHRALAAQGFGLLIHDGYRPWYVTKMFWDATPPDKHEFVADPAQGSRHNRGCAVDLTLYDLTDRPGRRDAEPVRRDVRALAYADYPGGTPRQRRLRALLRAAMEAQGFTVYPRNGGTSITGTGRRMPCRTRDSKSSPRPRCSHERRGHAQVAPRGIQRRRDRHHHHHHGAGAEGSARADARGVCARCCRCSSATC